MVRSCRRSLVLAVVTLPLAVASGGRSLASGEKDGGPDLSGRWTLNQALSEDPMEKLREGVSGRSSGGPGEGGGHGGWGMGGGRGGWGGGHGGHGGSGGGGGRTGGSRGEGGEPGEGAGTPNELLWDVSRLVVTESFDRNARFVVERADGGTRVLYADGRKVEEETGAGTTKIRAKRKSGKVVVDTEYPNGREVVETWELAPEPRRLVVTTKVEGKRGSFRFKRVYDPEPPAETPPSAAAPATATQPAARALAPSDTSAAPR